MADNQKPLKQFVRVMNTDIPGHYPLQRGLKKIKGIGPNLSRALCIRLELDGEKAINLHSAADLKTVEEILPVLP